MKPHSQLRDFWQLMAAGRVRISVFKNAVPEPVHMFQWKGAAPVPIEGVLRKLSVFANKACEPGRRNWWRVW